jgi:hypothetical protein
MRGIDARGFNNTLALLLPIPFLFLHGIGYFYYLDVEGINKLPKNHKFVFLNREGQKTNFTVPTTAAISFPNLKNGATFNRKKQLVVNTSVSGKKDNVDIRCTLRSGPKAKKSFLRSVLATVYKKNIACVYQPSDLADAPKKEDLFLTVTRSERQQLKAPISGTTSFSYISKSKRLRIK